uniref:Uncharacterized protein n=1 Tax=Rhizophora mucronata TaxID=61149 RepID=A0A2P2N2F3_RHIMU
MAKRKIKKTAFHFWKLEDYSLGSKVVDNKSHG